MKYHIPKYFMLFILSVLFIIPISHALVEDWMYSAEDALFEVEIGTSIKATNVKTLSANLTLYPRQNHRQTILSVESFPASDNFTFTWENPEKVELSVTAQVLTTNKRIQVNKKIPFPLEKHYDFYTSSTDNIDSNHPDIQALASRLAEGEDDLYELVFKVGLWVEKNINYSLDSITLEASLKSSWVLENRRGVCDEMTNLFIAMMRALDVPARFVSGYAYTSLDYFEKPWGPHGWAEVYFPEFGWVPVDLAYKEIGYIDLSHIQMKEATDATIASIVYKWNGDGITPDSLETIVKPLTIGKNKTSPLQMKSYIQEKESGFGSYNALHVDITNPTDYYYSTTIQIGSSESIMFHDPLYRLVLLGPKETKTESWLFSIDKNLKQDYVYTHFFVVKGEGDKQHPMMKSAAQFPVFTKESFQKNEKGNGYYFSDDIFIICALENKEMYIGETISVPCTISHNGTRYIPLELCVESCSQFSLQPQTIEQKEITFTAIKKGRQDIKITLKGNTFLKTSIIPITVFGEPNISIKATFPENITFKESAPFSFIFESSDVPVSDVFFSFSLNGKTINTDQAETLDKRNYMLTIPGKLFNPGENNLSLQITYADKKGEYHKQQKSYIVILYDVKWWQHVMIFFRNLFG